METCGAVEVRLGAIMPKIRRPRDIRSLIQVTVVQLMRQFARLALAFRARSADRAGSADDVLGIYHPSGGLAEDRGKGLRARRQQIGRMDRVLNSYVSVVKTQVRFRRASLEASALVSGNKLLTQFDRAEPL